MSLDRELVVTCLKVIGDRHVNINEQQLADMGLTEYTYVDGSYKNSDVVFRGTLRSGVIDINVSTKVRDAAESVIANYLTLIR